ncbi:MAG: hypothetical protein KDI15_07080, partial [Thiothrix sp.]|nr:hypothetical protein [Thiothrix sp.]
YEQDQKLIDHLQRTLTLKEEQLVRLEAELDNERHQHQCTTTLARQQLHAMTHFSHRLHAPIQGLCTRLKALAQTGLTAGQQDGLQTATASCDQLCEQVSRILDHALLRAGELKLRPDEFSPRQLVEDACRDWRRAARAKGLALHCLALDSLPTTMLGDRQYLRQILDSLLENAVHFTDSGEICLSLEEVESHNNLTRLHFEVRDTGKGIPLDDQEHIFAPFVRLDTQARPPHTGGSGLGLSLARELASLMGGSVHVESAPGIGSRFWFDVVLPVVRPHMARMDDHAMAGLVVLVLDPHETSLDILKKHLRNWHIRVLGAGNSQEALRQLQQAGRQQNAVAAAILCQRPGDTETRGFTWPLRPADEPPLLRLELNPDDAQEYPLFADVLRNRLNRYLSQRTAMDTTARKAGILLLTDNPINAIILQTMLEPLPVLLQTLHNSRDLESALALHPYRIILLDTAFPVQDTSQLIHKIRQHDPGNTPATVILTLVPHALQPQQPEWLQAGADGHLLQPVSREVLCHDIARWLKHPATDRADAAVPAVQAPEPHQSAPVPMP